MSRFSPITKNAISLLSGALFVLLALPAAAQTLPELTSPFSCPFCDLSNAQLANRNLTDANLQGANLTNANLSGADLSGAILSRANLTNANLSGAKLDRSAKGRADLSAANVMGINLKGASLAGTNLQHVDLTTFDHTGVDLSQTAVLKAENGNTVTCGNANLSNLQSRIYVSKSGTDGPSCGTSVANACAAIGHAITRCYGTAACGVLVMYGEYTPASTIVLADGINVYGGCVAGQAGGAALQSLVTAPPGGQPAMSAAGIGSRGAVVQGFRLQGTKGTASGASTALMLNFSRLEVIDTTFLAGAGGVGTAAPTVAPGADGAPGAGTAAGTNAQCPTGAGGNGSPPLAPEPGGTLQCFPPCYPPAVPNGPWGRGGPAAQGATGGPSPTNCACQCGGYGGPGNPGQPGHDAGCGRKGDRSSDTTGRFSGTDWQAAAGDAGSGGGTGGGGGGGGAGGYNVNYCFSYRGGPPGNAGGGGGGGGCGAAGGGGGGHGGASFAMTLFASQLTLTNSTVVGGRGGDGAIGASSESGGRRGAGAAGSTDNPTLTGAGGTGGHGGTGGAGGGGAGGNGGPAINIALVANSSVNETGVGSYAGASGSPGGFGLGGRPVVPGVCTGPDGDPGILGTVADKRTY